MHASVRKYIRTLYIIMFVIYFLTLNVHLLALSTIIYFLTLVGKLLALASEIYFLIRNGICWF